MTLSQSDHFPPWGENNPIGSSLLSEHSHDWSEMEQPSLIGSSLLSEHSRLSESSQMREIISERHKYRPKIRKQNQFSTKLQSVNLFHKFHMSSEILELVNFHTIFLQQPVKAVSSFAPLNSHPQSIILSLMRYIHYMVTVTTRLASSA